MSKQHWVIRKAIPKDIPFIYETWLKSYRLDSSLGRLTRSSIFFENYRTVVDKILQDSNTDIACLREDEDIILGYLVSEDKILHYSFVKEAFRKIGIAKSLVLHREVDGILKHKDFKITHETFHVERIVDKYELEFNPYLLFNRATKEQNEQ